MGRACVSEGLQLLTEFLIFQLVGVWVPCLRAAIIPVLLSDSEFAYPGRRSVSLPEANPPQLFQAVERCDGWRESPRPAHESDPRGILPAGYSAAAAQSQQVLLPHGFEGAKLVGTRAPVKVVVNEVEGDAGLARLARCDRG